MSILDQFGAPARNRFARSIVRNSGRGIVWNHQNEDIHESIPASDRRALSALSRRVVFNHGPAKEAIRQKASYSVGDAWRPEYGGPDVEAGEAAAAWLTDEWFPQMDFAGKIRCWRVFLEVISKAIDRDGESFLLLTTSPDTGLPAVMMVPAHAIRSEFGEKPATPGPWDGATLDDGIGRDEFGRVLFYRIYSTDTDFDDVPAASVIHGFDIDFPEQRRGYPAFAHALSDLLQAGESKELEILRQLIVSNVFLINKGGRVPQDGDAGFQATIDTANNESVLTEKVAPGIMYLKNGQEIETLTHNSPGEIWTAFRDSIWREAIIGAGWSVALVYQSTRQGTAERAEVVRARLAVRARIRTLLAIAKRVSTYGLSARAAPRVQEMDWNFTKPARLTVDDGREDRSQLEAVKCGGLSVGDYAAGKGQSRREHFRGLAMDRQVAAEVGQEFGFDGEDLMPRSDAPAPAEEPVTATSEL